MLIIGCDFHTRYQQIAMMDTETGELVERRLEHENGEARAFYARLPKPAGGWHTLEGRFVFRVPHPCGLCKGAIPETDFSRSPLKVDWRIVELRRSMCKKLRSGFSSARGRVYIIEQLDNLAEKIFDL